MTRTMSAWRRRSSMNVCGKRTDVLANLIGQTLLLQLDNGRACAALFGRSGGERGDVWMVAQEICDGAAERARAVPVNDANARKAVQVCFVEKLIDGCDGFVRCAADQIPLGVGFVLRLGQTHLRRARMRGGHAFELRLARGVGLRRAF